MENYSYYEEENGCRWIMNHVNGYRYPLFGHPEVNKDFSQEELKKVCEEIDKEFEEVAKNG